MKYHFEIRGEKEGIPFAVEARADFDHASLDVQAATGRQVPIEIEDAFWNALKKLAMANFNDGEKDEANESR